MNFHISDLEIEEQVLNFMDQLGIAPVDDRHIIIDGNIHRYRCEGDKRGETSGAYCIFNDNWPAGFVQDWRKNIKSDWAFNIKDLPIEHKQFLNSDKIRKEAEELRKKRQAQREKDAFIAAEHARIMWDTPQALKPADNSHPYLQRKKVNSYGLRVDENNSLVVPLSNINGVVNSLQFIPADPNQFKKFFPGASMEGLFWSIALDTLKYDEKLPILIGEGYATMAKVYELTSLPCVAAMNCGALKSIAQIIQKKFPLHKIIIIADDDANTKIKTGFNPGLEHAQAACEQLHLQGFISPPFKSPDDGSDWDDFAILHDNDDDTSAILKKSIAWLCLSVEEQNEFNLRDNIVSLVNKLDPNTQLEAQEFIGNMFPRKFVSAIVAPSGTGKTMFMQKTVSDLSLGGSILDGFSDEEPPRKSLIFAGEAGYELLIRRGASTKWPINPDNVLIVDQYKFESNDISVMLDTPDGWDNIKRTVDIYKPDIVFFDTFSSFHDKDENKASDMKPIIKKLADLARDYNLALVLVHHSRKRTAKERTLSLNQDDVIGSSIFNRLVSLIIGIEPMKEDEKTLLVRPLKTWFSTFMPFTYKLSEGFYGGTVMQIDLAPEGVNNSKIAVWNYLQDTFKPGEWFSLNNIVISEITPAVSIWQVKRILSDFVKNGKLKKQGTTKNSEYSIINSQSEI